VGGFHLIKWHDTFFSRTFLKTIRAMLAPLVQRAHQVQYYKSHQIVNNFSFSNCSGFLDILSDFKLCFEDYLDIVRTRLLLKSNIFTTCLNQTLRKIMTLFCNWHTKLKHSILLQLHIIITQSEYLLSPSCVVHTKTRANLCIYGTLVWESFANPVPVYFNFNVICTKCLWL